MTLDRWIELGLFVLNVGCSYLSARRVPAAWLLGMATYPGYLYLMWGQGLYNEIVTQTVLFLMSIFGWLLWRNQAGELKVFYAGPGSRALLAVGTLAAGLVMGFVGLKMGAQYPFLNGLGTVLYPVCTFLLARRWVEAWYGFIITNFVYMALFALTDFWWLVGCHVVYQALAFKGLFEWRRSFATQSF
jgi:nicotinamide mononucleotide transporter